MGLEEWWGHLHGAPTEDRTVGFLQHFAPTVSLHTALAPETQACVQGSHGSGPLARGAHIGAVVGRGAATGETTRDQVLQHKYLEKPCSTSCDKQADPRVDEKITRPL